ncbi:MAG: LysE family transporter [Saprospiraceae bacterium]|nr:LysE family transporter [Saprospiraceae bacterium]MCB0573107.1 LysE family transporter [Saprospiraceae bacterium]MCB9356644.1 LysE family transporter [Lewinellaceae bacterium]
MLIQGIFLGLSLSFMVGPLLFAILQAGIERGFRAGLAVAGGIWFSDVLYVIAVQYGMETMAAVTALPNFKVWAGLAGGMLLVAFGIGNLFIKKTAASEDPQYERAAPARRQRSYFQYWMKGFLLNTVNPFTVFFWIGIAGAVLIPGGWGTRELLLFFGGMLGTLVITDTLKAYAAKRIRCFLTPRHTQWVQRSIGFILVLFGLVLMARVL